MRSTPAFAGLALALLSYAFPSLARESPRSHVEGVASAIEQNYFDERRAKQISTGLRGAAAKGEFDKLTDKRELASALTIKLEPFDRHFRVGWTDAPREQPAADSPVISPAQSQAKHRRGNYGVRRAEVLSGNIGYIDLRGFAPFEFGVAGQPERQAIEAALQLLAGTDALIIDLRDNGGGAPQMVGYLSSAFVKKDADIFNTFHGRDRTMSEAPLDWYPQPRLDTPLFVLTSARTASAAEAFAYTLQSAKRATVVGETSMGAANPGGEVDAGHGFSVFVSFATPINPITKANWEGRGVTPDVAAEPAAALVTARRLALEAVLAKGLSPELATDTRWALDALRAEAGAWPQVPADDYAGAYGMMAVDTDQGRLVLQQGRRPVRTLLPLGGDNFAVLENASQRVVFQRNAKGLVEALELRHSDGDVKRHRRGE
ncbi:S41 family peptidase [Lysobacter sp. BMK333-48F3]|uniref:S41 family peptidase n=1 Tax=Lysobacter sp. BMK333-48F3 TaxID=2867962 RepID=UPI001C8C2159|nr:S41 family peptidase [Lysobacter sp. BMK333-48F3]MBX9400324.1 S41 family peptidase [Lysobacter sp. BMK333-48F3]